MSGSIRVAFLKRDSRARIPQRATPGSSGYDLRACLDAPRTLGPGETALIPTGLALAIPAGYEGQVRARSGLALEHGIAVLNGPGTIDSDYRGPLGVILANLGPEPFVVEHGARIAQIVFAAVAAADAVEVEELPESDRGEGGFGHSGMT